MCNAIQVAFCSGLISQNAWPPLAPTGWLWGSTSVYAGSGWQKQSLRQLAVVMFRKWIYAKLLQPCRICQKCLVVTHILLYAFGNILLKSYREEKVWFRFHFPARSASTRMWAEAREFIALVRMQLYRKESQGSNRQNLKLTSSPTEGWVISVFVFGEDEVTSWGVWWL